MFDIIMEISILLDAYLLNLSIRFIVNRLLENGKIFVNLRQRFLSNEQQNKESSNNKTNLIYYQFAWMYYSIWNYMGSLMYHHFRRISILYWFSNKIFLLIYYFQYFNPWIVYLWKKTLKLLKYMGFSSYSVTSLRSNNNNLI